VAASNELALSGGHLFLEPAQSLLGRFETLAFRSSGPFCASAEHRLITQLWSIDDNDLSRENSVWSGFQHGFAFWVILEARTMTRFARNGEFWRGSPGYAQAATPEGAPQGMDF
jgi:hypothetical protein